MKSHKGKIKNPFENNDVAIFVTPWNYNINKY